MLEKVVSRNLSRFLKGVKPLVLYDVDCGVFRKPMQGKLASSQFDFGYTEPFCIPGVTSMFFSSCDSVVGDSGVQSSKSRLLTCFIWKTQLLWTQWRGIGPHLAATGKSHGFSRVAAGTWCIFSSYLGDVHSKLEFVHWSQDTCLGMRDNSVM